MLWAGQGLGHLPGRAWEVSVSDVGRRLSAGPDAGGKLPEKRLVGADVGCAEGWREESSAAELAFSGRAGSPHLRGRRVWR
jgi:hypothetical protein